MVLILSSSLIPQIWNKEDYKTCDIGPLNCMYMYSVICDKTRPVLTNIAKFFWQQPCSVYIQFISAFHQLLDYFSMLLHTLKKCLYCVAELHWTADPQFVQSVFSIRWESLVVISCLMGWGERKVKLILLQLWGK